MNAQKVCRICGEQAKPNKIFHTHYGAICCTSCKAFFRRFHQDGKVLEMLNCIGYENNCEIKPVKRLKCKRCRLVKCLEIGLKPELVLSEEERQRKCHNNKRKRTTLGSVKDVSSVSSVSPMSSAKQMSNMGEISCVFPMSSQMTSVDEMDATNSVSTMSPVSAMSSSRSFSSSYPVLLEKSLGAPDLVSSLNHVSSLSTVKPVSSTTPMSSANLASSNRSKSSEGKMSSVGPGSSSGSLDRIGSEHDLCNLAKTSSMSQMSSVSPKVNREDSEISVLAKHMNDGCKKDSCDGINMKGVMFSLLKAQKMAENDHLLDGNITRLVIDAHLQGLPSSTFIRCFCEAIPANFIRQLGEFARNNSFFMSLSSNDKNALLSQNSTLYCKYIMARYFGADNGYDQLKFLLGPSVLQLTMAEVQGLSKISFDQLNRNGDLIPLTETRLITGFKQCYTIIQENCKYPQMSNGFIAFLLLMSTCHWTPELRRVLDEPQRILHVANFAKDIINFAKIGCDKQDQLLDSLVTMTTILNSRHLSLSRSIQNANDCEWLEGKLEIFDQASQLPLPNELFDCLLEFTNGNVDSRPQVSLFSANVLFKKFQFMIEGLGPNLKHWEKLKLARCNLHKAMSLMMVQCLHLQDFNQQLALIGVTDKKAHVEPLTFEKFNGKSPIMKKHQKFRCGQLRKVIGKFTASRKLLALVTFLTILDDPDKGSGTGLWRVLASFLLKTIQETPEFASFTNPEHALEDFFKSLQEYSGFLEKLRQETHGNQAARR